MSMQVLTKALESDAKGWYQDNRRHNADNDVDLNTVQYFALRAEEEGVGPDDAELEKRCKHFLRRFKVKEHEYQREQAVRDFARESWAIQKFWEEHGCPWKGPESPTVEKAFSTGPLEGTWPIFQETVIQGGRLTNSLLSRLVSDTVQTNSGIATHTEMTDTASTPTGAVRTAEGARTSQVNVTFRERKIPLIKFGYEALTTYEASRRARLPVLIRGLERLGRRFEYLIAEFALDVLILGDNSSVTLESGTAATVSNAATVAVTAAAAGAPTFAEVLTAVMSFSDEYAADLAIASTAAMTGLLSVPEFKDSQLFDFAATGNMIRPLGIEMLKWNSKGVSSGYANTKLVLHDTSVGLTQFTEGGVLSESERLISEGYLKTVTTLWVAFGVNDKEGTKVAAAFGV
jgi:hypothetical protein